ncbi:exonuclease SbcCD subunit D C-terminal domain-containing protein [bacterium]|nr:exonuclease SbcCD subunit D C-terminal domain-containing protein [bacterium]
MRILHTSDWHLGRVLYGRKRYEEFDRFLQWLVVTIKEEEIDLLLIAGDIFDTTTPSNLAQRLYYEFLSRVFKETDCHNVVITAGNHDSPSLLETSKELLKNFNIQVVGSISEDIHEEIFVLPDKNSGEPAVIVCAVPYLRDKDIRVAKEGEDFVEKDRQQIEGIRQHYADVASLAEKIKTDVEERFSKSIPVIAMGHLFVEGGSTVEGDGVRELYVGSLGQVGCDIFSDIFNYVALGHLHVPQKVHHSEHIRYSGSPLPMGFGEASQVKQVCIVEFSSKGMDVRTLDIPIFRKLRSISGNWFSIVESVAQLKKMDEPIWLEINFVSDEVRGNLVNDLKELVKGSKLEIISVKDVQSLQRLQNQISGEENLEDLDPQLVFSRCLEDKNIPLSQREELQSTYNEVLQALADQDLLAD